MQRVSHVYSLKTPSYVSFSPDSASKTLCLNLGSDFAYPACFIVSAESADPCLTSSRRVGRPLIVILISTLPDFPSCPVSVHSSVRARIEPDPTWLSLI